MVEWGPWLGSLTSSYCEGLAANPRANTRRKFAHVYDLFEWCPIFENWSANTPHARRFKPGEDFRDYFCELHRAHEHFLDVQRADLSAEQWTGQPIEWVINDAVKSLEIGTNLFSGWVPWMMPGKSEIAHQDYLWSNNSFIQVYMYLMRDCFAYEYAIPGSCMAVFRNTKQCDAQKLAGNGLEQKTLSKELINESFAWSRTLLKDVNPTLLALCHGATLRDFGFGDDARRIAVDHGLTGKISDPMIDFQREVLLSWGYSDMLSNGKEALK